MMVFLPVLVLTEGPAVARSITATTSLAGLAPTVPAALEVEEGKGDGQTRTDPTCPDNLPTDEKECVCVHACACMCMYALQGRAMHPQPRPRGKKK